MQVMEYFRTIASIPHCSGKTEAMKTFLVETLEKLNYRVEVDPSGNILATTADAVVTLQSHYDMVCIGQAPDLELYEASGWLKAENSTLGADNGIGMAMMLAMASDGARSDLLFTNDEEVGLIGARALEVDLKTPYMLNLDSEEEGMVTIGCAGGVDIIASLPISYETIEARRVERKIEGLPGGHSGIDIDKGIPNAIKELAANMEAEKGIRLIDLKGGERRNAIPRNARAICADTSEGREPLRVIRESELIVRMLHGFEHGVRAWDEELGMVETSINLAQVMVQGEELVVHLSGRSMKEAALRMLMQQSVHYFESYGCRVRTEGFYPPWQPDETEFARTVLNGVKSSSENAGFTALHAGLECGVIKERYPDIAMASIGPDITEPHSTREAVNIDSVGRVYASVCRIVDRLK